MNLPNIDEIYDLHQTYAPTNNVRESVWAHSQIVSQIALDLADKIPSLDAGLVQRGALLHDIGVYALFEEGTADMSQPYITHGVRGYELLKDEGFDESLCRFALLHTGVGITKEDVQRQSLPIPARDYVAETDEERLVMYADKFHSKKTPPTFNSAKWYRDYLMTNFGEQKVHTFDELVHEFGKPDLQPLKEQYGHTIR